MKYGLEILLWKSEYLIMEKICRCVRIFILQNNGDLCTFFYACNNDASTKMCHTMITRRCENCVSLLFSNKNPTIRIPYFHSKSCPNNKMGFGQ